MKCMEQVFYELFTESVQPQKKCEEERLVIKNEITYAQCYKNSSEWTKVIMHELENLITNYWKCIGMESTIHIQREYFRTDLSGWVDRKGELKDVKTELKQHLWDLQIVIEHENNPTDWTDELIKLIHIHCPLKVVISYHSEADEEQEELDVMAEWMKKIKAFASQSKSKDEKYLIILGDCKKADYTGGFHWRGYYFDYETGHFEKIELKNS